MVQFQPDLFARRLYIGKTWLTLLFVVRPVANDRDESSRCNLSNVLRTYLGTNGVGV